ncbi:NAD(P)/FAD-dependent oxidoreductase [Pseudogracilibacillus auburnensis]|uniref:Glycine/D-amino acid oxidase-like deaminating enzyme n=1 Tax=Pseudogracilibacillus auburnensis TaxID=1494959 RepID=A0A2V3VNQ2_9BACI|nr:FAD-binding oxidoreductase [Pseudogracilibacillus auburnensis]PXW83436.1 glycine/D-amino acid oxidase-like deaminating enzyme [Pseudogracilibacillus auburnensis]
MPKHSDVIIIGGGVIGSSIAYNLLNDGYTGQVTVFEKDKLYEFSSTPRSAGGVRQLFSTSVNIQIARYSLQKYLTFPEDMAIGEEKAEINFTQRGYLFLTSSKAGLNQLEAQMKLQTKHSVPSQLVQTTDLHTIIPELHIDDLYGGLYCAEDGYLDPYSVMQGYIRKAKQLGATYIYEEIDTILYEKGTVTGVQLKNSQTCSSPIVINCAGPWAPAISEKIHLPIPVVPLKRQIIQFDIEKPLKKKLPLTIDPTGVYFRHEGESLIAGYSEETKPGIDFQWKRSFFEEQLWPTLANRINNFERAKVVRGWAGLYSYNLKDQNAIIGEHPSLSGYYLACGFSGHGMQQAPAVGKGIAELMMTGAYRTLDLSALKFERFALNELVVEDAIV